MIMKLIGIVFALSLLLIIPGAYSLNVDFVGVSPQPAEPGGDLAITVSLTNPSSSDVFNFRTEFNVEYPFTLKSANDNFEEGFICGGCTIENTYFFAVDTLAISGIYELRFKALETGAGVEENLSVEVKGEPNIIFTADSNNLDKVIPGSDLVISMDVKNIGSDPAKELRISSDSSDFIALGSSIKTIDILSPKNSKTIFFQFLASKNLKADSYQIPFRIEYKDEDGNELNSSGSMGVRVIESGALNVQSIKVVSETTGSSIVAGVPFNIIVRVENVGTGDADFIATDIDCPFENPKRTFIGQLEKDEDSPAVFNLVSGEAGAFECTLNITYQDDLGEHSLTENFDVSIQNADISGNIIFLIIIILILLFVFRKKIFKGKNK